MASKIITEEDLRRPASEWLDVYEDFLRGCYHIGFLEDTEVIGEEIEELFDRRSGLAEALKAQPDGLTAEQRRHLWMLDKQLREMTPLIGDPYYAQRARKLGYPKSHWWWYLGEPKTDGKRGRRKAGRDGKQEKREMNQSAPCE